MNSFVLGARVLALIAIVFSTCRVYPQATQGTTTICIDHFGKSDRYIPPLVISDSGAGIQKGRFFLLRDVTGPTMTEEIRDSPVVSSGTMKQLIAVINAASPDGSETGRRGAWRFSVLLSQSEQSVILNNPHARALLKSLEDSIGDKGLQADLASLRRNISPN